MSKGMEDAKRLLNGTFKGKPEPETENYERVEDYEIKGTPEDENEFENVIPWEFIKMKRVGQAISGIIDHISEPDEHNKSAMIFLRNVNGLPDYNIKMFMHTDLSFKIRNLEQPEGKKVLIKLIDQVRTADGNMRNVYEVKVKRSK